MNKKIQKPLCIYHGNCADGFTAAWAVWRALEDVDFHEGIYGEEPPNCNGRRVIIVDFSYKRDVLIKMAGEAESILVLDHHKTAENDLVNLPPNVTVIFDKTQSGAMLAWNYFHNDEPSMLIYHVQDRDLWQFKSATTKEFMSNLFSYDFTMNNWDKINRICLDNNKYADFCLEGAAIQRKFTKDVNQLMKVGVRFEFLDGWYVPFLNVPFIFASEAGNIMCQGEQFAVCYWDTPEGKVYSLRSSEEGLDVSVIAEKFGGGGHRNAAGFTVRNNKND